MPWSIERSYFPSLIERGETFVAYVYNGYWIDIGTPEKYTQVHRDIMDGRYAAAPFRDIAAPRTWSPPTPGSKKAPRSKDPASSTKASLIKAGARDRPVLGDRPADADRRRRGRSAAPSSGPIAASAARPCIRDAILGRHCHVGRNVTVNAGAVLGDKTTLTDFTKSVIVMPGDTVHKMRINTDIFKAYDVRGPVSRRDQRRRRAADRPRLRRLPRARSGSASRATCASRRRRIAAAFIEGAREQGADVIDYGMLGTDMLYFAVVNDDLEGGAQITASHNPGAVQRHQDGPRRARCRSAAMPASATSAT